MVVFTNHRLGPSAELFVSDEVATVMLRLTAAAARPFAAARWELELVLWLDARADLGSQLLDVSEIAWTPDHFELQRDFLVAAIRRAAPADYALVFERWRNLIEAHPHDSVVVGRRWEWPGPNKGVRVDRSTAAMRDTAADAADGGERCEVTGYVGTSDLPLGR
jgi:hypothetical protein